MSAIIDNASSIKYQRQASIAQTKSQSGVRQAQRRGPLLYNFFVDVIPVRLGSPQYYAIEDEIMDSNYSELTVDNAEGGVQIRNGNLLTPRGTWAGTIVAAAESGTTQAGNNIRVSGITDNTSSFARKGDFVQFSGYTKVFQLTADVNPTGGIAILSLNGAIPASSPVTNTAVVVNGKDVRFRLQLKDRPEPEFTDIDIVNYGSAAFEEVL